MAPTPGRGQLEVTRQVPGLSKWNDCVDLHTTPGEPASYTVPVDADLIEIKFTAGLLWMNPNGTAAEPSAGVVNGSASEPVGWGQSLTVEGGETLSFQNDTACWVIISKRKN